MKTFHDPPKRRIPGGRKDPPDRRIPKTSKHPFPGLKTDPGHKSWTSKLQTDLGQTDPRQILDRP